MINGPVWHWRKHSVGGGGYIGYGLGWQERPGLGMYQARIALSATGPVNVEGRNDDGDVLLVPESIPATTGVASVALSVDAGPAPASTRAGTRSGRRWPRHQPVTG